MAGSSTALITACCNSSEMAAGDRLNSLEICSSHILSLCCLSLTSKQFEFKIGLEIGIVDARAVA